MANQIADKLRRLATQPVYAPHVVYANACREGWKEIDRLERLLEDQAPEPSILPPTPEERAAGINHEPVSWWNTERP